MNSLGLHARPALRAFDGIRDSQPSASAAGAARSATNGALLAESYSTGYGQFMLTLPLAGSAVADFQLPIVVEVWMATRFCSGSPNLRLPLAKQTGLTFSLTNASDSFCQYTRLRPPLVDEERGIYAA